MLSCKEVNRLCSEEQDRKLSLSERINLRMHLAICKACTNFRDQMRFLRSATRRYREGQRGPRRRLRPAVGGVLGWLGGCIGRYLSQPVEVDHLTPPTEPRRLLETLQPGDVLLVEGNSRVSGIIKYLTQSTWSHAALFVGDRLSAIAGAPNPAFVEADIVDGVRAVAADAYAGLPTRICRPAGIAPEDLQRVLDFAITRIGHRYDLRNVVDLARYLFPTPPVPQRFRRRMLSLGSGDPTRAICSTLIAQAFQSVRYPILPRTVRVAGDDPDCPECVEELMQLRHFSLFAPRDFDVSPYFEIIKPGIARAHAYRQLAWIDHGRANRPTGPHRRHRPPMQ